MEDNIKMEKSYSVGRIKVASGITPIVSFMLSFLKIRDISGHLHMTLYH